MLPTVTLTEQGENTMAHKDNILEQGSRCRDYTNTTLTHAFPLVLLFPDLSVYFRRKKTHVPHMILRPTIRAQNGVALVNRKYHQC